MSLVAYGASDESDASDVDVDEQSQTLSRDAKNDLVDDGKISDEDDYVPTNVLATKISSSTSTTNMSFLPTIPFSLSDLPAPQSVEESSSVTVDEEDELEDEVKPKVSQLSDAPKPPPKKSKQPTRIFIPALTQDDDEEEESSKHTARQATDNTGSGAGCGLFALLPPPVHSSRKQTNRPLIPYTLTKRQATSTRKPQQPQQQPPSRSADDSPLPSQKRQSAFNALTGYESDSDDEENLGGGGAFGLLTSGSQASLRTTGGEDRTMGSTEGSEGQGQLPSTLSEQAAPVTANELQPLCSPSSDSAMEGVASVSVSCLKTTGDVCDNDSGGESEVSSSVGLLQLNQDAPLTFSRSTHSGWPAAPLVSALGPEMFAATSPTAAWHRQQHLAQDTANTDQIVEAGTGIVGGSLESYMEDEQFVRLSGKRKRGQERMELVEAHVDDCVDPSQLMKGISEESAYQPHRKKDNMPSSQQKRKKQITYLAFQAKERELELKNAWSQNRMTKNQARSKYGF